MAESFEKLDNILHDWEKDKNKNSIVEALSRYEKHILAGKRKIKLFSFLENGTEKILPQSAVRLIHLINSTFLSRKKFLTQLLTLEMRNIKTPFLKIR